MKPGEESLVPLDPFFVKMLGLMAAGRRPAIADGTPQDARHLVAAGRSALGPAPGIGVVRDIRIPTRGGPLPGRHYSPTGNPAGLIVYIHGGGWVVGALDDFDVLARTLVAKTGCALVLPDYRLAPEYPFPAGLQDCEDTLTWADRERASLAGPGTAVVVVGDSAGANLATVAARRLQRQIKLAAQVLAYPVTDCDFGRPSYVEHGEGLILTGSDMKWFFAQYASPTAWPTPDVSPLRAPDLAGMPPAFILLAGYDVLFDEGEAYARRIEAAGIPVTVKLYGSLPHGFIRLHNLVGAAMTAIDDIASHVVTVCGPRSRR